MEDHIQKILWLVKYVTVPQSGINPLNAQLNPICHRLALLGAHPTFHVSRIRVNGVVISTFQSLMLLRLVGHSEDKLCHIAGVWDTLFGEYLMLHEDETAPKYRVILAYCCCLG
jgi:hypothetical protein